MKKSVAVSVIVVLIVLFIVFASFIKYRDISVYDIVSGIAIDYDDGKWKVTCEICMPSSNNDFGSKAEYVKGEGFTLKKALRQADLKSMNILYTDSVQLYLIGESASKQEELIKYMKSSKCNLRAIAVTTEGKASNVLHNEKESSTRAKSLSLSDKLKSLCDSKNDPTPHVMNFIKNKKIIHITKKGIPERSAED